MKGRSSRRFGWWISVGFAAAAVAACGTPSDTAPRASAGPDTGASDPTVEPSVPATPASSVVESVPTTDEPAGGSGDVSKWSEVDLGPAFGDDFVSLTELGGEVWAARLTEQRDAFEVWQLAGGQVHRIEAPLGSNPPRLLGTPFGLILITSDYESFLSTTRLSTDGGATWTETLISNRPFDVAGVTAVDGVLLASGALRPEIEPGVGPFTPGMFRSDDGVNWTEIFLDPTVFAMSDSYLGGIIDLGDRLVVSGTLDDDGYRLAAMFESLDRGATWRVASDSGPVPTAVVTAGLTLVGVSAFLSPLDAATPLSTNSADERRVVDLARFSPPFQYTTTSALSGGPSALISLVVEPTTEYCYEHVDECQQGSRPVLLLVSSDGSVVSIDLGITSTSWPTSALVASDGSLHVVTFRDERLAIRTWDAANGAVPTMPDVAPLTPSGPPLVEWDATLDIGLTYRFPLGTHCGIDVLGDFNGQHWWIVGSPEAAYDQYRSDMTQRLLGEINVVNDRTIEYRVDGELIATYAPSAEEPPGCD